MKRHLILLALPLLMTTALPANAAIHEMVAAYCAGVSKGSIDENGFLEPPGVSPGANAFAKPVRSSGVVVGTAPNVQIGDSPAAKYPAGTLVGLINNGTVGPDHPSADHCANMQTIP